MARQGELEACGALNGGQMGRREGGSGGGLGVEKTLSDATSTLHLYFEYSMGQPGNYVTEGSSQMRACLGLCLGGQPG